MRVFRINKGALLGSLILAAGLLLAASAAGGEPPEHSSGYAHLPLSFEPNRGQAAPNVKFLARARSATISLSAREWTLRRIAPRDGSASPHILPVPAGKAALYSLRVELLGANPAAAAEASGALSGASNYFIGKNPAQWIRNVPTYSRVKFHAIYPEIDAVYYGSSREMEFDFVVAAGADPRAIRLRIGGRRRRIRLRIEPDGNLLAPTAAGNVRLRKPRAWQETANPSNRRAVPVCYRLENGNEVSFALGDYDRARPLIIDPVLSYSTFLGGTDFNFASGIAVDGSGNTYLTGYTTSLDFPVQGGVQSSFAGGNCNTEVNTAPCFDAFVAKLNPQGTGLLYSTYLGGTGDDRGIRIAVNAAGEATVAGFTNSPDFPTASAFQSAPGGGACGTTAYPEPCFDAFAAKLSASGSSLVYATYLGGSGDDFARDVAVDSSGNAYLAGLTSAANFPTTSGALQTSFAGGPFDGFVTKIGPDGTALVYSTYLGGSGEDQVAGIALDTSGNVYVTGQTNSANFRTQGGFQPAYTATSCGSSVNSFPCFEAFVSKLNAAGTSLVYSSYLGGTAASYGNAIALDAALNAYITGWTTSKDFPVTASAYQASYNGSNEAFIAKVNAAGGALAYATYLGGANPSVSNAIAVDASGNAHVAGYAYGGGFPAVLPLQAASGGFYDAFAAKLNAAGSALVYSTYLGGTGNDYANDLALDASGNLYVAGATFSTDFPTTPSVLITAYTGGSYDAWAAKIGPQNAAGLSAVPNPLAFPSQPVNASSAPQTVRLGDAGSAPLGISSIVMTGDFAQTNHCGEAVAPATTCSVSVTFKPTAPGARTGAMTITDSAAGSPHTVRLTGYGAGGGVSLSATALDFGSVPVGTTSASQAVTLTNTASSPLTISGVQALGEYGQSNTCGSAVSAGGSCTITVTFSPLSTGTLVGSVVITDSAAGSPQTITLTGTGVSSFSLTAQATSVTVLQGTAQVTFTVSASAAPGFTGSITLGCANIAPATCSFSPATIAPGSSSTLTVGNLAEITASSMSFTVTGTLTSSTQTVLATEASSDPTTATLTLTVRFADFGLAASASPASIDAGQTATFTLTLTPINGFNLTVALGCAGAPDTTSCTLSPPSVNMDGSANPPVTLQFATTSRSALAPPAGVRPLPRQFLRWVLLGAILALLAARQRRTALPARMIEASLMLLVCLLMVSCGGGGGGSIPPPPASPGTPAGTYALTVTATAESLSHAATVTVTVK